MAASGGQPGNQNAARGRKWREAIQRALARKAGTVELGLDAAADKLVSLAIDAGDKWALEEIGNRHDGKPVQSTLHAGDEDGGPVQHHHTFEVVKRGERPAP